jgi:hypothetical protein
MHAKTTIEILWLEKKLKEKIKEKKSQYPLM